MKKEIRITPKQLRGLLLLLLLLPVVPSAILVRFMWDTFEGERVSAREESIFSHRRQLALVALRAAVSGGGEREVEGYIGDALAITGRVTVRGADPDGEHERVMRDGDAGGGVVLVRPLGGRLEGKVVEVRLEGGDLVFKEGERQMLRTTVIVGVLLGGVLVSGGLAWLAVSHQLRSERMKSDFLATIAHELKTPVASTRVLLDTLRESDVLDAGGREEYLDLIARENERLGAILETFLSHWRLEQKREDFHMEPVSPGEIARAAAMTVAAEIEARDGRIAVKIPDGLEMISVDKDAIIRVLRCLLDNALKYSLKAPDIALDVFQDGRSVFFQVGDHGIGVPKGHRRRIFEKFYRVDQRLSRRGGGCGLGLSISKMIVEGHGGRIGVMSRKRQPGSVFWVQLPMGED